MECLSFLPALVLHRCTLQGGPRRDIPHWLAHGLPSMGSGQKNTRWNPGIRVRIRVKLSFGVKVRVKRPGGGGV